MTGTPTPDIVEALCAAPAHMVQDCSAQEIADTQLLADFGLWVLILFRGAQSFLTWENMWSTPAWLFYGCSVMVFFLFFTINMTPKTNVRREGKHRIGQHPLPRATRDHT